MTKISALLPWALGWLSSVVDGIARFPTVLPQAGRVGCREFSFLAFPVCASLETGALTMGCGDFAVQGLGSSLVIAVIACRYCYYYHFSP